MFRYRIRPNSLHTKAALLKVYARVTSDRENFSAHKAHGEYHQPLCESNSTSWSKPILEANFVQFVDEA